MHDERDEPLVRRAQGMRLLRSKRRGEMQREFNICLGVAREKGERLLDARRLQPHEFFCPT